MDWFLYDNGLRHERVNTFKVTFIYHLKTKIFMNMFLGILFKLGLLF